MAHPWLVRQVAVPPPSPETLPAVMMIMTFLQDRGLLRSLAVFKDEASSLWLPYAVRNAPGVSFLPSGV